MAVGAISAEESIIRFGSFELNVIRRTIYRNGVRLKLQKQPFSVLELLIERAPEIVSREEIRRHIWGDNVHVDAEQGIAFCIRQIRSVLGDHSVSPHYIQTIPREGFRFIAAVEMSSRKRATTSILVWSRGQSYFIAADLGW
jgi:DNA-binding winged helix-turn-helix (wHTH) protein